MIYLSISDAAKTLNITPRRLQQMCAAGKIIGARKEGGRWVVPQDTIGSKTDSKKPLPIGISDYKVATSEYIMLTRRC